MTGGSSYKSKPDYTQPQTLTGPSGVIPDYRSVAAVHSVYVEVGTDVKRGGDG